MKLGTYMFHLTFV